MVHKNIIIVMWHNWEFSKGGGGGGERWGRRVTAIKITIMHFYNTASPNALPWVKEG